MVYPLGMDDGDVLLIIVYNRQAQNTTTVNNIGAHSDSGGAPILLFWLLFLCMRLYRHGRAYFHIQDFQEESAPAASCAAETVLVNMRLLILKAEMAQGSRLMSGRKRLNKLMFFTLATAAPVFFPWG